tara:strand:- start:510 stop:749 length:240 start_codon:yes stop_codon:yes gene_type:complete
MKTKKLSPNNRNFLYMGIDDKKAKTVIYLYGESKTTGAKQWYESKTLFTKKTALNYFYSGQYSCVFAGGLTKSSTTNWI